MKKKIKNDLDFVIFSVRTVFLLVGLFFIVMGIGTIIKEPDIAMLVMGIIMLIIGIVFLTFLCVELYYWFKPEKEKGENGML